MLRNISIGKRIIAIIFIMLLCVGGISLAFLQSLDAVKLLSIDSVGKVMYRGQENKLTPRQKASREA